MSKVIVEILPSYLDQAIIDAKKFNIRILEEKEHQKNLIRYKKYESAILSNWHFITCDELLLQIK